MPLPFQENIVYEYQPGQITHIIRNNINRIKRPAGNNQLKRFDK